MGRHSGGPLPSMGIRRPNTSTSVYRRPPTSGSGWSSYPSVHSPQTTAGFLPPSGTSSFLSTARQSTPSPQPHSSFRSTLLNAEVALREALGGEDIPEKPDRFSTLACLETLSSIAETLGEEGRIVDVIGAHLEKAIYAVQPEDRELWVPYFSHSEGLIDKEREIKSLTESYEAEIEALKQQLEEKTREAEAREKEINEHKETIVYLKKGVKEEFNQLRDRYDELVEVSTVLKDKLVKLNYEVASRYGAEAIGPDGYLDAIQARKDILKKLIKADKKIVAVLEGRDITYTKSIELPPMGKENRMNHLLHDIESDLQMFQSDLKDSQLRESFLEEAVAAIDLQVDFVEEKQDLWNKEEQPKVPEDDPELNEKIRNAAESYAVADLSLELKQSVTDKLNESETRMVKIFEKMRSVTQSRLMKLAGSLRKVVLPQWSEDRVEAANGVLSLMREKCFNFVHSVEDKFTSYAEFDPKITRIQVSLPDSTVGVKSLMFTALEDVKKCLEPVEKMAEHYTCIADFLKFSGGSFHFAFEEDQLLNVIEHLQLEMTKQWPESILSEIKMNCFKARQSLFHLLEGFEKRSSQLSDEHFYEDFSLAIIKLEGDNKTELTKQCVSMVDFITGMESSLRSFHIDLLSAEERLPHAFHTHFGTQGEGGVWSSTIFKSTHEWESELAIFFADNHYSDVVAHEVNNLIEGQHKILRFINGEYVDQINKIFNLAVLRLKTIGGIRRTVYDGDRDLNFKAVREVAYRKKDKQLETYTAHKVFHEKKLDTNLGWWRNTVEQQKLSHKDIIEHTRKLEIKLEKLETLHEELKDNVINRCRENIGKCGDIKVIMTHIRDEAKNIDWFPVAVDDIMRAVKGCHTAVGRRIEDMKEEDRNKTKKIYFLEQKLSEEDKAKRDLEWQLEEQKSKVAELETTLSEEERKAQEQKLLEQRQKEREADLEKEMRSELENIESSDKEGGDDEDGASQATVAQDEQKDGVFLTQSVEEGGSEVTVPAATPQANASSKHLLEESDGEEEILGWSRERERSFAPQALKALEESEEIPNFAFNPIVGTTQYLDSQVLQFLEEKIQRCKTRITEDKERGTFMKGVARSLTRGLNRSIRNLKKALTETDLELRRKLSVETTVSPEEVAKQGKQMLSMITASEILARHVDTVGKIVEGDGKEALATMEYHCIQLKKGAAAASATLSAARQEATKIDRSRSTSIGSDGTESEVIARGTYNTNPLQKQTSRHSIMSSGGKSVADGRPETAETSKTPGSENTDNREAKELAKRMDKLKKKAKQEIMGMKEKLDKANVDHEIITAEKEMMEGEIEKLTQERDELLKQVAEISLRGLSGPLPASRGDNAGLGDETTTIASDLIKDIHTNSDDMSDGESASSGSETDSADKVDFDDFTLSSAVRSTSQASKGRTAGGSQRRRQNLLGGLGMEYLPSLTQKNEETAEHADHIYTSTFGKKDWAAAKKDKNRGHEIGLGSELQDARKEAMGLKTTKRKSGKTAGIDVGGENDPKSMMEVLQSFMDDPDLQAQSKSLRKSVASKFDQKNPLTALEGFKRHASSAGEMQRLNPSKSTAHMKPTRKAMTPKPMKRQLGSPSPTKSKVGAAALGGGLGGGRLSM